MARTLRLAVTVVGDPTAGSGWLGPSLAHLRRTLDAEGHDERVRIECWVTAMTAETYADLLADPRAHHGDEGPDRVDVLAVPDLRLARSLHEAAAPVVLLRSDEDDPEVLTRELLPLIFPGAGRGGWRRRAGARR